MSKKSSSISLLPPETLRNDIVEITVQFCTFNGEKQTGFIEVHTSIKNDIKALFEYMYSIQFPLQSVIPISEFDYDDDASMAANNTSGFNFRTVALDETRISNHGYGLAIDINPVQNPYIKGNQILPETGHYQIGQPGTLDAKHPVVLFMKKRGFVWGLVWGFIIGLFGGLFGDLTTTTGFAINLVVGPAAGLVIGFVLGLGQEFLE